MVELFTAGCLGPTPGLVIGPVPPVARLEAPHASRGCTSRGPADLTARAPWTGFAPALRQDGFSNSLPKSVHVARIQKPWKLSDRTSGLLCEYVWETKPAAQKQDYSDEPPSNRRSRSHGNPALRVSTKRVVKPLP